MSPTSAQRSDADEIAFRPAQRLLPMVTSKQLDTLRCVVEWTERCGAAPSIADIGEALGLKWVNTVRCRVEYLIRDGYLTREPHKRRSLRVTPNGLRLIGRDPDRAPDADALAPAVAIRLRADAWRRFVAALPSSRNPSECWPWQSRTRPDGYGLIGAMGERWAAHRLAWVFAHGEIPDGMCVCHRCDNPPCVNPGHLFLGTKDDNNKDRARKGRSAKGDAAGPRKHPERMSRPGEASGNAKLTDAEVLAIRAAYGSGMRQSALALMYRTTQTNISLIVRRKHWRHLPAEGQPK